MTGADPELSIVIPMRDAGTTIAAQLDALRCQEWSGTWEIVVADNGSSDAGPALVRAAAEADARIRLVDASSARGPSIARNIGADAARGRHLAFCDADDVVGAGWVAAMGNALRNGAAATGPQEQALLNPPWLIDVHGSAPGQRLQVFADVFPYGSSANLGIRRSVFRELGGFEPSIHVGEDIDLCFRLWIAGHVLHFVPGAVVHYRHRQNLGSLFRQAVRYGAAGPLLVRRMQQHGLPRPGAWSGLRNAAWLVRNLPALRTARGRARWVVVAGRLLGRSVGSVRHRTLYL